MPELGPSLRSEWLLDPSITYLNHGTVGATPRRVLAAQAALRDEIERQPAQFLLRELTDLDRPSDASPKRLRIAADAVGRFVGVGGDELAFVDNATSGANAVLGSFRLSPGDEVLVTSLGYGGVTRAVERAARRSGATVVTATMPEPGAEPAAFVDAVAAAIDRRTRLVVVDHVTSKTALVLPIRAIVDACRAAGVRVLVDGAHVPGAMPLDIPSIGADWYVANLHKWAWVPRSSGILWAAADVRAELEPTVTSWGLDHGFTREFDWPGTRDPTPHLTAPVAIDLLHEWGFDAICDHNRRLARWVGHHVADRFGVAFDTPEEMVGTMVSVDLPPAAGTGEDAAVRLQDALLREDGIEVPIAAGPDRLRARISAQVYVGEEDVDRFADAVLRRVGV